MGESNEARQKNSKNRKKAPAIRVTYQFVQHPDPAESQRRHEQALARLIRQLRELVK